MLFQVPAKLVPRLSETARQSIEGVVNNGHYKGRSDDFRSQLAEYFALCVIDDKRMTGAFMSAIYNQDPTRFSELSAERERFNQMIESLDPSDDERAAQISRNARLPPVDVDEKDTPEDVEFSRGFRMASEQEARTQMERAASREAAAAITNPDAEAASVMKHDNPYSRVSDAAARLRQGRRVNLRLLTFTKE